MNGLLRLGWSRLSGGVEARPSSPLPTTAVGLTPCLHLHPWQSIHPPHLHKPYLSKTVQSSILSCFLLTLWTPPLPSMPTHPSCPTQRLLFRLATGPALPFPFLTHHFPTWSSTWQVLSIPGCQAYGTWTRSFWQLLLPPLTEGLSKDEATVEETRVEAFCITSFNHLDPTTAVPESQQILCLGWFLLRICNLQLKGV